MSADLTMSLAVGGATKSLTDTLASGETALLTVILDAAAADVAVELGGITNPRVIAVYGGTGVSVRLVATTGQVLNADPVALLTAKASGFAQTTLYLSNSGSQPVSVTVVAAQ